MGFAETFYAQRFGQLGVEDLPEARRTRRLVAVQLGSDRTQALWREGAEMGMAAAMRLALALTQEETRAQTDTVTGGTPTPSL